MKDLVEGPKELARQYQKCHNYQFGDNFYKFKSSPKFYLKSRLCHLLNLAYTQRLQKTPLKFPENRIYGWQREFHLRV